MIVRRMCVADADGVARLVREMRYQATPQDIAHRFAAVKALPEHELFVAERVGVIVGFAQVHTVQRIHTGAYVSVAALVVAAEWRAQGVGKGLLQVCKAWAQERGYPELRLP
jgi:GNAT superfamily N-acetyltransferase